MAGGPYEPQLASSTRHLAMHAACKDGSVERVSDLLRGDPSLLDVLDEDRRAPIYVASMHGRLEVVQLLHSAGANPSHGMRFGTTPLCVACLGGHLAVVRFLESVGASVHAGNHDGNTPLYAACENGFLEVVRFLVACGVSLDKPNCGNTTPVNMASWRGHVQVVRFLADMGADLNYPNNIGATPFYMACQEGKVEVVRELASRGVDLERSVHGGFTPLFAACRSGATDVVALLLARGVNLGCKTNNPTPLVVAAQRGHVGVVRLLVDHGARTDGALVAACSHRQAEVMGCLLEAGADPHVADAHGRTVLHVAALRGFDEIVRLLVDGWGLDFLREDKLGRRPLVLAQPHVRTWLYLLWKESE